MNFRFFCLFFFSIFSSATMANQFFGEVGGAITFADNEDLVDRSIEARGSFSYKHAKGVFISTHLGLGVGFQDEDDASDNLGVKGFGGNKIKVGYVVEDTGGIFALLGSRVNILIRDKEFSSNDDATIDYLTEGSSFGALGQLNFTNIIMSAYLFREFTDYEIYDTEFDTETNFSGTLNVAGANLKWFPTDNIYFWLGSSHIRSKITYPYSSEATIDKDVMHTVGVSGQIGSRFNWLAGLATIDSSQSISLAFSSTFGQGNVKQRRKLGIAPAMITPFDLPL